MTAVLPDTVDWTQAACLSADTEMFYPEVGGAFAEAAKRICDRCYVRQACLDWALSLPETEGIWGGLTPSERRRLRKKDVWNRREGRAA